MSKWQTIPTVVYKDLKAEHQRLKDAVVDAAKVWANNDKGFTRIALRQKTFELWEFEQEHKNG